MSDKKVMSLESQKRTAYFCSCNKTNGTMPSSITICDKKMSVSCDLKKSKSRQNQPVLCDQRGLSPRSLVLCQIIHNTVSKVKR